MLSEEYSTSPKGIVCYAYDLWDYNHRSAKFERGRDDIGHAIYSGKACAYDTIVKHITGRAAGSFENRAELESFFGTS